jgi:hypothetical protein
MFVPELEQAVGAFRNEVDAEARRLVREGEQRGSLDLDQFALYVSLSTLLTATEATCGAILHHEAEKGVTI